MNSSDAFRGAVERGDLGAMIDAFSDEAVLQSPVSFRPFAGRKAIGGLLYVLMEVFTEFRYTDELVSDDGTTALVFRARVGDRDVEGIDLLRFDDDGQIRDLTVMVRPLSALEALRDAVGPRLQSLGSGADQQANGERLPSGPGSSIRR